MSREKGVTLKGFFETGDIPTQSEYASLIDSTIPNNYNITNNSGTGSAYTVTFPEPYTTLLNMVIVIQFDKTNIGYSTLKVDNLSAIPINKNGNIPIVSNDIKQTAIYTLAYDNQSSSFVIIGEINTQNVNLSSTQWSDSLISSVPFPNGSYKNGFTFFNNSNIVLGGTTTYNEFSISYGIEIELSGIGSADINLNGTNYQLLFNNNLDTTALNFVTVNQVTLNALNISVFNINANATSPFGVKNARLRFSAAKITLDGMTITNTSGTLNGTISNPFTGDASSTQDHVVIPYLLEPYNGQRLQHNFRVNFGLGSNNNQSIALSLRRFANDTIIGSEIPIIGQNDVPSQQTTFITYTANANDPFVTGGFYFALRNDSGANLTIQNAIGILLQNYFEKPTFFIP